MISDSIAAVRERIRAACGRVERDPGSVRLIGVTKGRAADVVRQAFASGLRDVGENRVQEAIAKYAVLRTQEFPAEKRPRWHLVGHLQTNKVRDAVRIFDVIHSVDSLRIAEAIQRRCSAEARKLDVLLEVNVSGEPGKHGFRPDEVLGTLKAVRQLQDLRIIGLMAVGPRTGDRRRIRESFRMLRELREAVKNTGDAGIFRELSMGMSDDFETAVEEGSTMVRVGRAIFEG